MKCRFNFALVLCLTLFCGVTTRAQNEISTILPPSPDLAPYRWFASTDPQHKNADYILLKPGETRRVPLAGGRLERLWSTSSEPDKLRLDLLQVTADGFSDKMLGLLNEGRASLGTFKDKTYTLYPTFKAPVILPASTTLIAVNRSNKESKWFYQVAIRPVAATKSLQSTAGPIVPIVGERAQMKSPESFGAVDVSKGNRYGEVTEIAITLQPATLQTLNRVFLRAFPTAPRGRGPGSLTESERAPSEVDPEYAVNAPLSAFTGQFFGLEKKSDAVSSFDGKTLTIRWPMPFDSARDQPVVDLFNQSDGRLKVKMAIKVRQLSSQPPQIFHAAFGSALSKRGAPIPILRAQGKGVLVGLALAIKPDSNWRRRPAYLEGNEKIVADGRVYEGTGSEDFFNSAWYFPARPFNDAFGGMTFKRDSPPQVAMYRWMIPDALPFSRSLSFDFEHGNNNNSDDLEYRWLACWYQAPGGKWTIADQLQDNPDTGADPQRESERAAIVRRYILGTMGAMIGLIVLATLISLWRRRPKLS